jgi:hypothetical protein
MTGQLDQAKPEAEQSMEGSEKAASPLHASLETGLMPDRTEPPQLKMVGDKIEVPPITTNGWQKDTTTSNTKDQTFLDLTNPFKSLTLDIVGRKWSTDSTIATAAPKADLNARKVADASPEVRAAAPSAAPVEGFNKKILDASTALIDKQGWKGSGLEKSTQNGKYGGAATVSNILKSQGYDYAHSAGIHKLTTQLSSHGWKMLPVSEAKPGDVVFAGKGSDWKNGGGKGRIGIVGQDGNVQYNNAENGKWTQTAMSDAFSKQQYGEQIWVLRPPAEGPKHQRPAEQRTTERRTTVDAQRRSFESRDRQTEFSPDSDQARRPRGQQDRMDSRDARRSVEPGNNQDYRNFRNRPAWSGQDNGRYPPQYDDSSSKSDNPISILWNAIEGVGKALWSLTPFRNSVNNGRLGCAASVSEVLQRSGYRYANHAGVGGLDVQLRQNGWRRAPLDQAAPGDVVVVGRSRGWRAGGGSAHVGIVGENSSVYHNSSSRGQWIKDNLHARFGRGMEVFVLKPPANGRHEIDQRLFEYNPDPSAVFRRNQPTWGQPNGFANFFSSDDGHQYRRFHNTSREARSAGPRVHQTDVPGYRPREDSRGDRRQRGQNVGYQPSYENPGYSQDSLPRFTQNDRSNVDPRDTFEQMRQRRLREQREEEERPRYRRRNRR